MRGGEDEESVLDVLAYGSRDWWSEVRQYGLSREDAVDVVVGAISNVVRRVCHYS